MGDVDVFAGIVGSDGHLSRDKSTIFVINKDEEFMDKIVLPLILNITGKRPTKKFVSAGFGNGKFKINVSSSKLWKILNQVYSIPSGAKSLTIEPPKLEGIEQKIDFIGGWIAGDGSVTVDRTRPKLEVWSKSLSMLVWIRSVLIELNIKSMIFHARRRNLHILRVGQKAAVLELHRRLIIPHPGKERRLSTLCSKASCFSSN